MLAILLFNFNFLLFLSFGRLSVERSRSRVCCLLLAAGQHGFSVFRALCSQYDRSKLHSHVGDAMSCVLFMVIVDIAALSLKKTSAGDIVFAAQMTWHRQPVSMWNRMREGAWSGQNRDGRYGHC